MTRRTVSFVFRISIPHLLLLPPLASVEVLLCCRHMEDNASCLSNICSLFLLVSRTPTLFKHAMCPDKKSVLPPSPWQPGVVIYHSSSQEDWAGLSVKLQFPDTCAVPSYLPPVVLLPLLFFPSGIQMWWLEEKQPSCDHGDKCLMLRVMEQKEGKVWGLHWPALAYKPSDFLLYKTNTSLLFRPVAQGFLLFAAKSILLKNWGIHIT